jgi:hypothetical protein
MSSLQDFRLKIEGELVCAIVGKELESNAAMNKQLVILIFFTVLAPFFITYEVLRNRQYTLISFCYKCEGWNDEQKTLIS